jgi:DNA-binding MarR family transcriptional regulator
MSDSRHTGLRRNDVTRRLSELAEFRYQVRRFINFSEAAAEELGVQGQQYQMMQVVGTVPEGSQATISYVAERMVLRHNSAVELVDRAVRAGLVQRIADAVDHRKSVVELTDRGRDLLLQLAERHILELERVGAKIARALSDAVGTQTARGVKS